MYFMLIRALSDILLLIKTWQVAYACVGKRARKLFLFKPCACVLEYDQEVI
jgi:hypothetical protein